MVAVVVLPLIQQGLLLMVAELVQLMAQQGAVQQTPVAVAVPQERQAVLRVLEVQVLY